MFNIYETLKQQKYFVDNEYLQSYCRLIECHRRTKRRCSATHKHHIIPKSWFKLMSLPVNNDLNNLVNLPYREHVLAHYYLCLCTEDPFTYANQLGLVCLLSLKHKNPVDKRLLSELPMYNNIYESYTNKLHSGYKLYKDLADGY